MRKIFLVSLFLFAGCTQKAGETCKINSDCSDELICCLANQSDETGICKTAEECSGNSNNITDAGTDSDGSDSN